MVANGLCCIIGGRAPFGEKVLPSGAFGGSDGEAGGVIGEDDAFAEGATPEEGEDFENAEF